ncbi:MAG: phosphoribosyltransferase family protein [Candidatus Peribacteraceae bacterium]|jgi:ComF family protein|nr:phosphoribosyltransferase family protein [Candidatus Peribacteraceae bacterium]|tara:strand:- start:4048 stop:4677 length:630 start_codon:yes stop_codon:yes gene_type:complete
MPTAIDLFFPRKSLSGKSGKWITEHEKKRLMFKPVTEDEERLRERGLDFIDTIYAGSSYERSPLLHKAIHTFKYKRIRILAKDMTEIMLKNSPDLGHTVLCPVPLHWSRLFSRGFNQSKLLSELLAQKCRIHSMNLLKRTRPTGHQMKRKKSERLTALKGAFRVKSKLLPSHVILIDDLSTTGATLDECAKALKEAGVERVEGWVIAHG